LTYEVSAKRRDLSKKKRLIRRGLGHIILNLSHRTIKTKENCQSIFHRRLLANRTPLAIDRKTAVLFIKIIFD